jgi:apolipoprotein N-acyltransferase
VSETASTSQREAAQPRLENRIGLGIAALVASAAMLYFGTGLRPVWWLVWIAVIPVLAVAPRLERAWAFGAGALAWFAGFFNLWHYVHGYIGLPVGVILLFASVPAILFGLTVLAFRAFALRGGLASATLAVPAIWVAFEYVAESTSPNSTFGNLGYTQMNFLPVTQIASLTGIWAISFCVFLFSAGVAALLSGQGSRAGRIRVAAVVAVVLGAVLVYGVWRLHSTPEGSGSVQVGIIGTGTEHEFPQTDTAGMELLRLYAGRIVADASRGAQVFVLPEKITRMSDGGTAQVDSLFQATAAQVHAAVVVGLDRGTQTRRLNEARMYWPNGTVTTYVKHHLVPRLEDVDEPGTERTVMREPSGVWGTQICKDMDFPHLSRQYGESRVGLLLVPAWDFVIDGWLHDRMAILRGVEDGFTIVRAAKEGRLTVSDSRGRVLAEQNNETGGFHELFATAPVAHVDTLYAKWGDWFAWVNLALLAGLLVTLFARKSAQSR